MKRFAIVATACLALSAPAFGQSQSQETYLQIDAGIDYYPPNDLNGQGFDIDPGFALGGRIGTHLLGFRGELELGLAASTVDLEIDAGGNDLDYYQLSFTAGAYKDIGPVYLGAGAGLVYQEIEAEVLGVTISNGETNFIVHGEVGVTIGLSETFDLVPHYRATWLPGFELDDEVIVHSGRLGLRWRL